jgi:hypothetical protein
LLKKCLPAQARPRQQNKKATNNFFIAWNMHFIISILWIQIMNLYEEQTYLWNNDKMFLSNSNLLWSLAREMELLNCIFCRTSVFNHYASTPVKSLPCLELYVKFIWGGSWEPESLLGVLEYGRFWFNRTACARSQRWGLYTRHFLPISALASTKSS